MAPDIADHGFERIVNDNADDLHAYCLRRLPRDLAADAVSEVFVTAWRRIDEFPQDAEARLWLFGVAQNVVRNVKRTQRRQARVEARVAGLAQTQAGGPEVVVVMAEEHREVIAAFDGLKHSDQEILRLRLWEELSTLETAVVLGCSDKAASKRYQRAVGRLRAALLASSEKRRFSVWTVPHATNEGGEASYERSDGCRGEVPEFESGP